MIKVSAGFSVDDFSQADVSRLVRVMQPILAAQDGASWEIDLAGSQYLGPTAAVVLASARLLASQKSQVTRVLLPKSPLPLVGFCSFSGLTQLMATGAIGATTDSDHRENETAPLQQFHRESWAGSTPIVRLIRRHLPSLGSEPETLLRSCYSEIAQNIQDHADSPIGGVICARYFAGKHEIRIAVVDRGLGIGERLRRSEKTTRIKIRDDGHALKLVLQGNVSSKSRPNNMGQGISNLGLIAAGNGGQLMILSGRAAAVVNATGDRISPLAESGFPGTLVLLSLRVTIGDSGDDRE